MPAPTIGAAETADNAAVPYWDVFAQYGLLGAALFAMGFLLFKVWNRQTAREDRNEAASKERIDRLEVEKAELHLAIRESVIPAVLSATHAITECTTLLGQLQREREREQDFARHQGRLNEGRI